MERLRIGFAGVGTMGQCAHLRNYYMQAGAEVVAIAEPRSQLADDVASRYHVPRVYGTAAEMLAAEKLDALIASQPFARHGVLVPELLQAGIPIFTEKPLASTLAAGEKIVAAVQQSGSWLMLGYHKRSDPAAMYAHEQIRQLQASGELGRLRYIRLVMPAGDWIANGFTEFIKTTEAAPQGQYSPPATDMDATTFAAYTDFVNYYIHQINLMRYLLGEPYRVTYADPGGVLLATVSESGVAGSIEMSPYRTTIAWQEQALVAFERGYVRIDFPAPLTHNRPGRVEVLRDPGGGVTPIVTEPHLPWVDAMQQQAINFLAAVRGERAPMCEAAEGLEDLRVACDYIRLRYPN